MRPLEASSSDLSKEGDPGDDSIMLLVMETLLGILMDRLVAKNDHETM